MEADDGWVAVHYLRDDAGQYIGVLVAKDILGVAHPPNGAGWPSHGGGGGGDDVLEGLAVARGAPTCPGGGSTTALTKPVKEG